MEELRDGRLVDVDRLLEVLRKLSGYTETLLEEYGWEYALSLKESELNECAKLVKEARELTGEKR